MRNEKREVKSEKRENRIPNSEFQVSKEISMTEDDKMEFAEVFIMIQEYYRKEKSDTVIEIYFQSLSSLTIEEFRGACILATRSLKFFPTVSELLEFAKGTREQQALVAWRFVEENLHHASRITPDMPAPAGTHETIALMGGWQKAGRWLESETAFRRKEFLEMFTTEQRESLLTGTFAPVRIGSVVNRLLR